MTSTITAESRAQALSDEMLDREMVFIVSTECRALIAAAIREAEDAAYERMAALCEKATPGAVEQATRAISAMFEDLPTEIRSLKSPPPPKETR